MEPSKSDLMKIANEGFPMVDDYCRYRGARKKQQLPPPPVPQQEYVNKYEHQPQKSHVYWAPAAAKEAVVMDCYEVARLYGGTVIVDHYPKAKKPPMRMA